MLGAQGDEVLALADRRVVLASGGHRRRDLVEDASGLLGLHVVDVVGGLAAMDRDGRRCIDTDAACIAAPRRLVEVLGNAVAVLRRPTLGRCVAGPGTSTGDVEQDQPKGSTDRSVGSVTGAECAEAGVEPTLDCGLSVHDQERRDRVGGGVDTPEVEVGVRERPHCGDEYRKVLGPAARQHGVDRNGATRGLARTGRQHCDDLVGVDGSAVDRSERPKHGVDPFRGWCLER